MTDIVERLRGQITSDHIRGCMGRQYSCDCGYDAETQKLLEEAADEVERLQAALRAVADYKPGSDHQAVLDTVRAALDPKP
jgi:hypothetical protein